MNFGCINKTAQFKGKTESDRIKHFFEWSFTKIIERSPMEMAYIGIKKKQDQLDNFSEDYGQKTVELMKEHLEILESFSRTELQLSEQLNYDLYKKGLQDKIEEWKWRDYTYVVNQMYGLQASLPEFMINIHKVNSEQDLKNYIARLNGFKVALGEAVTQLMKSETQGVVLPKFVFKKVIPSSKNLITGAPFTKSSKKSPLWKDFLSKLKKLNLSQKEKEKYKSLAKKSLQESVGIGFRNLISFLESQERRATNRDGVWKFPKGREYYQYRLKAMTTLDYKAEKIHQLGLQNVARIHKEMNEIKKKVNFKGSLQEFFKHMQGDQFLYSHTKKGRKKYLKQATSYINNMRGKLDTFFITKPKANIVVKPVEAFREKSAGMAFYMQPAVDGSRPGTYYVNLSNMRALPRWEAEALAYHEGIPGHHMQLSIAQELRDVPKFRRFLRFTAYIEGWGLYSERFPKDYGFYKDPYSDFGRLSMELVRACRLVVDTGIHHKKWSREQAIKYLDKNTPGDHMDNVRQINRYIVMPGQATAYMIGMLKILELRKNAKLKMGKKFDIRKFHDVILTSGAVPLDTMEKLVQAYIESS